MTKEFLKQHLEKLKEAKALEFEIQNMQNMVKSPTLSWTPIAHTNSDKIGEIVSKIEIKQVRLLAKINAILEEEKEIERVIDTLKDGREKAVCRYRYISGLSWEEVCVKAHYSWQHVHRIHATALKNMNM